MSLEMSLIDRVEVEYDVVAKLPDGTSDPVVALDLAVVRARSGVDGDTVWKTLSVSDGTATVVYSGPEATAETDDLLVPLGEVDVYVRKVDGPLAKASHIERILCRQF